MKQVVCHSIVVMRIEITGEIYIERVQKGVGIVRDIWPGEMTLAVFHSGTILGTLTEQGETIKQIMNM